MMTIKRLGVRRVLAIGLLVGLSATTALAQRGGGYNSYSGNVRYDGQFVFVRMSYPTGFGNGRGGQPPWAHDYNTGEQHFMKILTTVSNVAGHVMESSIMAFSDPEMFKFPVIYLCEPGPQFSLSDADAKNLRAYLDKGGFMIVDDFRYQHWNYFEYWMSKAYPEAKWIDLDAKHQVFHSFFEINNPHNIPQYYDPPPPIFRALFEDNDPNKRMLVMANYNTDISEYWEFSEQGYRPMNETNEAYKIGVNEFIYAITH